MGSRVCLGRAVSVLWILLPGSLGWEGEAELLGGQSYWPLAVSPRRDMDGRPFLSSFAGPVHL